MCVCVCVCVFRRRSETTQRHHVVPPPSAPTPCHYPPPPPVTRTRRPSWTSTCPASSRLPAASRPRAPAPLTATDPPCPGARARSPLPRRSAATLRTPAELAATTTTRPPSCRASPPGTSTTISTTTTAAREAPARPTPVSSWRRRRRSVCRVFAVEPPACSHAAEAWAVSTRAGAAQPQTWPWGESPPYPPCSGVPSAGFSPYLKTSRH